MSVAAVKPQQLGPWPARMVNPIKNYDWGSTVALARLQSKNPTGESEAELWMGAHPSAPSLIEHPDGSTLALDAAISAEPGNILGEQVLAKHGERLPFLLKMMAIAHPLSVQVHPSPERAQAVHDNPTLAPENPYVDRYAKPEMLYALEPVDALCGFRTDEQIHLLRTHLTGATAAVWQATSTGADAALVLRALVAWPATERATLVAEVAAECRELLRTHLADLAPEDRRALQWVQRLAVDYPEDPMALAPLVLPVVHLDPGGVLYLPAGTPHAYLYGLAVELCANSDNTVRAGLTSKQVAVAELNEILDDTARPTTEVPFTWLSPAEVAWQPPIADFQLSRIWATSTSPVPTYPWAAGPQVLLCTSGPVQVTCGQHTVALNPGESAFIGATGGPVYVRGPGEVFRACAGQG